MSGDQERLTRIAKVADAAIRMDDAARTLFLHAICQDDRSLMSDIELEIESRLVSSLSEPVESEFEVHDDLDDTSVEQDEAMFGQGDALPSIDLDLVFGAEDEADEAEESPFDLAVRNGFDPADSESDDVWVTAEPELETDLIIEEPEPEADTSQITGQTEIDASADPEPEFDSGADTLVVDAPDSWYEPDVQEPASFVPEPKSLVPEPEREPEPELEVELELESDSDLELEWGPDPQAEEPGRPFVDRLDHPGDTASNFDADTTEEELYESEDEPSRFDLAVAAALETTDRAEESPDLDPNRGDPADEPALDVLDTEYEPDVYEPTSDIQEPESGLGAETTFGPFSAKALWDLDLTVEVASDPGEQELAVGKNSFEIEAEVANVDDIDVVDDDYAAGDGLSGRPVEDAEPPAEPERVVDGVLTDIEVDDTALSNVEPEVEEEPLPTEPVGPYRLVEHLGRGRTSRVYVGERADLETDRQVAIKLFDTGFGDDSLDERFYFEGDVLASLEHPQIAEFLDGSLTESGQVYLVMELVRGATIEQYANSRDLDERGRLQLFQEVCRIVHFGHQHLVIHRDLKPENVRVLETGEVKLVDFGIAKLIERESPRAHDDEDEEPVAVSAFASPEQRKGEVLTTVSDVYSLGVLLHKLLTGKLPESTRPGTDITGRKDLDAIIRKALREDPSSRYGSAEALASDIQRYLDYSPVDAYPDSFGYRFGKLVSRHKFAFGAGATAVVLSLGFAATMALGIVGF